MAGVAAVAAAGDLIHDVVAPTRRIMPAQREIAAGAGGRGRHLVRQRLHQRGEHGLGDALRHLRRAAGHGARVARVEERAFRALDDQRLERAGIDRHIWEDMAHGQIDGRQRGRQHAVHRAGAGFRGAGKIERQRPALLLDGERDGEGLVHHPIGIDEGFRAVGSVRYGGDLGAHLLGGAAAQLADRLAHRFVSVTVQDFRQSLAPDQQGGGLGLDVADALVGDTDVGRDDGEDFRVEDALLEQFYRRQAQAFLLYRRGRGGKAARHRATDIGPMAGVGKPAEDFSLPVDRHEEAHVHQVRAAEIGIVDDIDVALLRRQAASVADHLDDGAGGILHDADEDRQALVALRDQRAVFGRVDAVGAVVRLGDHRREGCTGESEIHLVAGLLQGGLDDGEGEGVEDGYGDGHGAACLPPPCGEGLRVGVDCQNERIAAMASASAPPPLTPPHKGEGNFAA